MFRRQFPGTKPARLGYRVVRLDAKVVMQDTDAAVAVVRAALTAPG